MQEHNNANNTTNTKIINDFYFDKEPYFSLDGSLDYYSKSKSKKYRGYKYRTLPMERTY